MMLGVWALLFLWGLVTPCEGLLETVGTLARIDKDELSKGEIRYALCLPSETEELGLLGKSVLPGF